MYTLNSRWFHLIIFLCIPVRMNAEVGNFYHFPVAVEPLLKRDNNRVASISSGFSALPSGHVPDSDNGSGDGSSTKVLFLPIAGMFTAQCVFLAYDKNNDIVRLKMSLLQALVKTISGIPLSKVGVITVPTKIEYSVLRESNKTVDNDTDVYMYLFIFMMPSNSMDLFMKRFQNQFIIQDEHKTKRFRSSCPDLRFTSISDYVRALSLVFGSQRDFSTCYEPFNTSCPSNPWCALDYSQFMDVDAVRNKWCDIAPEFFSSMELTAEGLVIPKVVDDMHAYTELSSLTFDSDGIFGYALPNIRPRIGAVCRAVIDMSGMPPPATGLPTEDTYYDHFSHFQENDAFAGRMGDISSLVKLPEPTGNLSRAKQLRRMQKRVDRSLDVLRKKTTWKGKQRVFKDVMDIIEKEVLFGQTFPDVFRQIFDEYNTSIMPFEDKDEFKEVFEFKDCKWDVSPDIDRELLQLSSFIHMLYTAADHTRICVIQNIILSATNMTGNNISVAMVGPAAAGKTRILEIVKRYMLLHAQTKPMNSCSNKGVFASSKEIEAACVITDEKPPYLRTVKGVPVNPDSLEAIKTALTMDYLSEAANKRTFIHPQTGEMVALNDHLRPFIMAFACNELDGLPPSILSRLLLMVQHKESAWSKTKKSKSALNRRRDVLALVADATKIKDVTRRLFWISGWLNYHVAVVHLYQVVGLLPPVNMDLVSTFLIQLKDFLQAYVGNVRSTEQLGSYIRMLVIRRALTLAFRVKGTAMDKKSVVERWMFVATKLVADESICIRAVTDIVLQTYDRLVDMMVEHVITLFLEHIDPFVSLEVNPVEMTNELTLEFENFYPVVNAKFEEYGNDRVSNALQQIKKIKIEGSHLPLISHFTNQRKTSFTLHRSIFGRYLSDYVRKFCWFVTTLDERLTKNGWGGLPRDTTGTYYLLDLDTHHFVKNGVLKNVALKNVFLRKSKDLDYLFTKSELDPLTESVMSHALRHIDVIKRIGPLNRESMKNKDVDLEYDRLTKDTDSPDSPMVTERTVYLHTGLLVEFVELVAKDEKGSLAIDTMLNNLTCIANKSTLEQTVVVAVPIKEEIIPFPNCVSLKPSSRQLEMRNWQWTNQAIVEMSGNASEQSHQHLICEKEGYNSEDYLCDDISRKWFGVQLPDEYRRAELYKAHRAAFPSEGAKSYPKDFIADIECEAEKPGDKKKFSDHIAATKAFALSDLATTPATARKGDTPESRAIPSSVNVRSAATPASAALRGKAGPAYPVTVKEFDQFDQHEMEEDEYSDFFDEDEEDDDSVFGDEPNDEDTRHSYLDYDVAGTGKRNPKKKKQTAATQDSSRGAVHLSVFGQLGRKRKE